MVWEIIIAKEKYISHSLETKSRTHRIVHFLPLINVGFPSKQTPILIIANGKPWHFLRIPWDISFKWGGHAEVSPKTLLKNSFWECSLLRGWMLWTYPFKLEQHDVATLIILVVAIILLFKLFSGRADFTSFHASVLQISSTMTKYLHICNKFQH